MKLVILAIVLFFAVSGQAQSPDLEPGANRIPGVVNNTPIPTVTFTLDWPEAKPQHYTISIESSGRAAFVAVDDMSKPGDPYIEKFAATAAIRDRIFSAARQLNYFQGKFDYTKHRIAFTGRKTLTYSDPDRHTQTTFNWSENARVMDVAHLFMSIANTLNGGRRLDYLRRYDRLGLEAELKEMQVEAKDGSLAEVQAIAPLLQQIADDSAVIGIARQRARTLLLLAPAETPAAAPSR